MIRFIIILGLCFIYMVYEIAPSEELESIFLLFCLIAYLLVFPQLNRKGKILTGFLFIVGLLLHFAQGSRGFALLEGFNQNMALLSIMILAPLISIPLKQEGIIASVVSKLHEQKNNDRNTFYGVSSFMMFLAPILNMGALRIVHSLVANLKIPSRLLSNSYYGGFTPAFIWSPFFASVGIVLYMMDLPYLSYMLVGIIFALLQILIGFLVLRPNQNGPVDNQQMEMSHSGEKRNFIILLVFIITLLTTLILEESITHQPMLLLVSINCLFVPIVWAVVRQNWSGLKEEIIVFKERVSTKSSMEIGLFLTAGLFGNALVQTPIVDVLEKAIIWSSEGSIILLFFFLIAFITMMAAMGIHQIIVVPIVISILVSSVDVNPYTIAFMCIFAWMMSASISPINPLNVVISQCVGKNGVTVALRWNGKYFLAITGVAFVYVYLLNLVG